MAAILTVSVTMASAGAASAEEADSPAESIANHIGEIAPDVALSQTIDLGDEFASSTGSGLVSIPSDAATPVEIMPLSGATGLSVSLPTLEGTGSAELASDGTVVYPSEDSAYLAVQPLADGGTRFLSVLQDRGAPTEYEYTFDGAELQILDDGSVTVSNDGEVTGRIDPAWALDADGASVPTHYVVEGDSLTQVVDHAAGDFAYPITADPNWWDVAKCTAAITWVVGSTVFAASKILKIKKYIKALGGTKDAVQLMLRASTAEERLRVGGTALMGLASEVLGVAAVREACF